MRAWLILRCRPQAESSSAYDKTDASAQFRTAPRIILKPSAMPEVIIPVMQEKILGTRPTKYTWKRLRTSHVVGAVALFVLLWTLFRLLPGEDTGGIAILPAMTALFCRPEGQREWLLALLAALAVAVVQLACLFIGLAVVGIWPPRGLLTGSNSHQVITALGMLLGVLVAFPAITGLGRKPAAPVGDVERTTVDLAPFQAGMLIAVSFAVLFGIVFAERLIHQTAAFAPPGFSLLAMLITLWSGSVTLIAWPQADMRKLLLLARFGLSFLVGVAGYLVYAAVYHHYGESSPSLVPLLVFFAVHIVAPTLGWWQLKRFARQHGMLRWNGPQDMEAEA